MKTWRTSGAYPADAVFKARCRFFDGPRGFAVLELHVGGNEKIVRPQVQRADFVDRSQRVSGAGFGVQQPAQA